MKLHRSLCFLFLVVGLSGSLPLTLAAQSRAAAAQPPSQPDGDSKPALKLDLAACVRVQRGELPIIISAPHGGTGEIPKVEPRQGKGMEKGGAGFYTGRDAGTEQLALAVAAEIKKKLGREPWYVISRVHRKYIDFNRPAEFGYEDPDARPVYEHYHDSIADACRVIAEEHRCGLLIDIHGQGTSRSTVFRGTRNGRTTALLQQRFGKSAQTGEESLFGLLATRGWKVHPDPFDGKEHVNFTGGYIVGTYGSHHQTAIDAVQLEFGADYTSNDARQKTAEVLADALSAYAAKYLPAQPDREK